MITGLDACFMMCDLPSPGMCRRVATDVNHCYFRYLRPWLQDVPKADLDALYGMPRRLHQLMHGSFDSANPVYRRGLPRTQRHLRRMMTRATFCTMVRNGFLAAARAIGGPSSAAHCYEMLAAMGCP